MSQSQTAQSGPPGLKLEPGQILYRPQVGFNRADQGQFDPVAVVRDYHQPGPWHRVCHP